MKMIVLEKNLESSGQTALSDKEILAILLRTGIKNQNVIELGKKLNQGNIQNLEIKEAYRSTIRAQLSHQINKNMPFFY